jgi:signal transduction histidine kinase
VTDPGPASPTAPSPRRVGDAAAVVGPQVASAALWAAALQSVADLVAHDLRNALNAVAVNLEVVRSRSSRGADASGIAPFATTAASQFEAAATAAEALLSLVRPESSDKVDVASLFARLATILGVGGRRTLRVDDRSRGQAIADAPADMVRAAVARSVLSALSVEDAVACEITADDGIFVRVTGATRVPPLPDPELVELALTWGIEFASRGHTLELRFSRSTHAPPQTHS